MTNNSHPKQRVALYVRVSTTRQADRDLSIPDQIKHARDYCAARGLELFETFVEPGASATDDQRPEFRRMIEAATSAIRQFDVVLVHSMSRFFRDQFLSEMYIRKLRRAGVKLISMTQDFQDDPTGNLVRQVLGSFDEYQSRENAKHTLRAMEENARQASGMARNRRLATKRWCRNGGDKSSRRFWRSGKTRPLSSAGSSTWHWVERVSRLASRPS